ncbi:hypothetical protein HQ535_13020 [bacterium]|nr:hypothetical protein [bacterium]
MDTMDPPVTPPDLAPVEDLVDALNAAPATEAPALADEIADLLESALDSPGDQEGSS